MSSMGLLGNLGETFGNLSNAFSALFSQSFQSNNILTGMTKGSYLFVRESLFALTGSVSAVASSFYSGIKYLVIPQDEHEAGGDKSVFEEDIRTLGKDISQFSSPFAVIDSQNRIWVKIVTREKLSFEEKKRMLRKERHLGLEGAEGDLNQFFRRKADSSEGGRAAHAFRKLSQILLFAPNQLWNVSSSAFRRLNKAVEQEAPAAIKT